MRLLWLTENFPPQRGGMAQSCDRIVTGLRSEGYEIELIHFTAQTVPLTRVQQQGGGKTSITHIESESHTLNVAWSYIKTLGDFDFVVAFGGYLSMIGAPVFARWMGTKLITFLRGNDFDTSIFTPRKREMLEYALKESSVVFSVTQDKVWKLNKWLPEVNAQFVPNGIDLAAWEPATSERDFASNWRSKQDQAHCFGLFGQLKAKKGIDFFLEAFRKTNLVAKVHLLFIGEIEESFSATLEEANINYTHLEFLDRYQLMKYYLCCDAVVIPSYYEGMPNVMLEAGALGIPVIASNVDGMKDMINHNEEGLLFEVGNIDACRRSLYDFMNLPDHGKSLGKSLKNKILNSYSSSHETQNYKELIG